MADRSQDEPVELVLTIELDGRVLSYRIAGLTLEAVAARVPALVARAGKELAPLPEACEPRLFGDE